VKATVLPAEVVTRLRAAEPTYREVGATADVLPSGYRWQRRSVRVGSGNAVFEAAAAAVLGWQVQLRAGLRVSASSAMAQAGTVVTLGLGPLPLTAPCRVVYVVADPRRRGFAYGTLPGHPESGEESFVVERHDDDTVSFTITAFSRPATLLARATGPVGVAVQDWVTGRYLRALRHARMSNL
jgi:uncharacterized protein (UPF0548 family)